MYHVSKLASRSVKVCLGGQAADELFGGYARYTLTHPLKSGLGMLSRRRRAGREVNTHAAVGGNLRRQLFDRATLRRLAGDVASMHDWRNLYFSNFAKVPESVWTEVFAAPEMVSRENCWLLFREGVDRSPARDPAAKAMHWDAETYLPGLFQQDDRMSMACSLESRVPFADLRLAEFAFRLPFDAKVRGGASKWLLRQSLADVLPEEVLNRRKVGFDTPIERWMSGPHAGFVRETLLCRRARERGWWNPAAITRWLHDPRRALWTDVVWKVLCVELWAQAYLDGSP
jgi:asparagine synthase (glutamine-hydrolysing)